MRMRKNHPLKCGNGCSDINKGKDVLEDLHKQQQMLNQKENGFYRQLVKLNKQKPIPRTLLASLLLLILLILLSTPSYGAAADPSSSSEKKFKREVVRLKLFFQWPPSYCTGQIAIDKGGCKEMPEKWLIHGLLGYDVNGQSIDCSKHPKHPDITKEVTDGTTEGLDVYWRNLLNGKNDDEFWTEQWIKHGCCLGLTSEEYFNLALRIKNKIAEEIAVETPEKEEVGLNKLFVNRGLKPDPKDQYSPGKFPAALYDELGFVTEIECNERDQNKHLQLHEINFCITTNEELVDCDTLGNYKLGKCTTKKLGILYPTKSEPQSRSKSKEVGSCRSDKSKG